MSTFLKEKERDTEGLIQRADDYVLARNLSNFGQKDEKRKNRLVGRTADPCQREPYDRQKHPSAPYVENYLCSQPGHVAAQCRINKGQQK